MSTRAAATAVAPQPGPMAAVPVLGIHSRWKSDADELKVATKAFDAFANPQGAPHQRYAALKVYVEGGNPFKDVLEPSQPRQGPLLAAVVDCLWGDPLILGSWPVRMLEGVAQEQWLPGFAQVSAYAFWRWRLQVQVPPANARVFLEGPATVLASCLYLGWMDEARWVADSIRGAYQARRIANVSGAGCQPLNHFLLRIAFDFWSTPFEGWGKGHNPRLDPRLDPKDIFKKNQCFGEPVLNELFQHWRDPDLSGFSRHLQWLADYTTHRIRTDCEFAYGGPVAARMPGVLLPLIRLRRCLGLDTAAIDHPLMSAPYARLPQSAPQCSDPLLERVLDRLQREELPDLRGGGC